MEEWIGHGSEKWLLPSCSHLERGVAMQLQTNTQWLQVLTWRCVCRCTSTKGCFFNTKNTAFCTFPVAWSASCSLHQCLASLNGAGATKDFSERTGHFLESLSLKDLPGNVNADTERKQSSPTIFHSIPQLRGRQVCSVPSCTPGAAGNQERHLVWSSVLLGAFFWWASWETQFIKPARNSKTHSRGYVVSCNRIPLQPRRASPLKVWLEGITSALPYSSPTTQAPNVNDSACFITVACTLSIIIRDEEGLGSGTTPG